MEKILYDYTKENGRKDRVYSVAEAVEYLNLHYPKVAPKSEETIRRAIRTKQLKAVMNQGREGHQIYEADLKAYGDAKYGKKLKKTGLMVADTIRQVLTSEGEPGKFYEILKRYMNRELDSAHYKLKLYEEKAKWEEKRKDLLCQKQLLENELERCDSEIQAFNHEIGQPPYNQ